MREQNFWITLLISKRCYGSLQLKIFTCVHISKYIMSTQGPFNSMKNNPVLMKQEALFAMPNVATSQL